MTPVDCARAALVCGIGSVGLALAGSFFASADDWPLWVASALLAVAMVAFLLEADRRSGS